MKIYLLPGLGFDHRIFQNLELNDLDVSYLNWIEPKSKEHISSYAKRFSERIDWSVEKIILIGHSFGGIIAQEIASQLPISKVILMSSIKSRKELPLHFKIVKPLGLHWLFTKGITTRTIKYWGKTYDYSSPEEQDLVKSMVNAHSTAYLQWALRQLSIWGKEKRELSTDIFQIHGELDRTFPIGLIGVADKVIKGAGHFMVYKEAGRISGMLEAEVNKDST